MEKRSKMKRLILILLLFFASPVGAADYYVDTTCTDTNPASATVDGTAYDPTGPACTGGADSYYVTIADLNAKSFSAGDNIYLRKGQTIVGDWTMNDSGSNGSPITITSFGSGNRPIIDGNAAASGNCIDLGSADWVDVGGLRLTNADGTNFRMQGGCDNINIDDMEIDNSVQAHGIYYIGDDLLVSNSTIHDNGAGGSDHGIYVDNSAAITTNVTIEYNTFYNNDENLPSAPSLATWTH
ncbi:hypothetical protein LCGC14_2228920, partial [marine sediment metagenome]